MTPLSCGYTADNLCYGVLLVKPLYPELNALRISERRKFKRRCYVIILMNLFFHDLLSNSPKYSAMRKLLLHFPLDDSCPVPAPQAAEVPSQIEDGLIGCAFPKRGQQGESL